MRTPAPRLLSYLLISTLATLAFARQQPPPQQQPPPPPVVSPEVHPDGSVTFRLRDPDAKTVTVAIEGEKDPLPMQQDSAGIWSATTRALPPDIYGYSFNADGLHLLDPRNTDIKPNLLQLSNTVHVTGASPMPWDDTDIAHGVIHHHFYRSSIVGDNRDFYVYTPPGYNPSAATRYPVLYLLHGYSDDASGWTAVGKANLILDSLISEGKARPMIVVMPLGYGAPEIVHPTPGAPPPFRNNELRERNYDRFSSSLIDEVMPAVESMYKVDPSRDSRAIAGLSMGGAESLLTGLNRLDKFSYIGGFSAGGLSEDFATQFPQLKTAAGVGIHLLWVSCGTEDRLITPNRQLIGWLREQGLQVKSVETPGMHTWMVWRRNLAAFAPLLFRPADAS
jgi:enterochelin esterase-like enzyme